MKGDCLRVQLAKIYVKCIVKFVKVLYFKILINGGIEIVLITLSRETDS